jgi:hypothetical protein
MKTKEIKFACGHKGEPKSLPDDPVQREQRIMWLEEKGICKECYVAKMRAEEDREMEEISMSLAELQLPLLEGSEKQTKWADNIRLKIIDGFVGKNGGIETVMEKILKHKGSDTKEGKMATVVDSVLNKTSAHFWIDNRTLTFKDMLKREIEKIKNPAADEAPF